MTPFKPIELTIKALIETGMPDSEGKIGGDLSYTPDQEFYVWIGPIPGGGSTDETSGSWAVDIDVFGKNYLETMDRALDLEVLLLGARGFRHDSQQVDRVFQSAAPHEGFWDDDTVTRITATYTFSARRSG